MNQEGKQNLRMPFKFVKGLPHMCHATNQIHIEG